MPARVRMRAACRGNAAKNHANQRPVFVWKLPWRAGHGSELVEEWEGQRYGGSLQVQHRTHRTWLSLVTDDREEMSRVSVLVEGVGTPEGTDVVAKFSTELGDHVDCLWRSHSGPPAFQPCSESAPLAQEAVDEYSMTTEHCACVGIRCSTLSWRPRGDVKNVLWKEWERQR